MTTQDHRSAGSYGRQARDKEVAEAPAADHRALMHHIGTYIGQPTTVCHEIVSEYVHVDVHVVPPDDKRNFTTLVTMGMSDRPMSPPPGAEEGRYAELLMTLPADWKIDGPDADRWPWRWPADWLQGLARLPHRYRSWSFLYHSFSNGDPPQPYGLGVAFAGGFLGFPASFHPDIVKIEVAPGKVVHFLAAIPVYPAELAFKQKEGGQALARKLWAAGVHDRLNVKRLSVV